MSPEIQQELKPFGYVVFWRFQYKWKNGDAPEWNTDWSNWDMHPKRKVYLNILVAQEAIEAFKNSGAYKSNDEFKILPVYL
jgi:hypothetical protein